MTVKSWIWRSMIAGLAGSAVHLSFMYLKSRTGLLPAFQPYQSYRAMLGHWVGADVPAIVPWALSLLNGMTILGSLFARLNRLLPGRTSAAKGCSLPSAGSLWGSSSFR